MGGQQGQGVESCGEILGRVLAQEGYSLFSQRLFASRIKGGHTTIALRIAASHRVATIGEYVDCLVALDQETIDKHGAEVRDGGIIIADAAFHPKWEAHTGRIFLALPITEIAKAHGSMQMKNMAALGMSAGSWDSRKTRSSSSSQTASARKAKPSSMKTSRSSWKAMTRR